MVPLAISHLCPGKQLLYLCRLFLVSQPPQWLISKEGWATEVKNLLGARDSVWGCGEGVGQPAK